MDCDPLCRYLQTEIGWCRRYDWNVGDPPERKEECEEEYNRAQAEAHEEDCKDDKRNFRSIDNG